MQHTPSVRSVLASVGLVGVGMLASPWRTAPQDPGSFDARLRALEAVLTPEHGVLLMKMLPQIRVVELDNADGSTSTTIQLAGVNLQIVNGLGATNGFPSNPRSLDPSETAVNGMGNLIVGYNEGTDQDDRTGSHSIVVGTHHQYGSFGGLVVGRGNTISGAFSSVSAGQDNTASGSLSSVSGGADNIASDVFASVSGGSGNVASGRQSSVSGGSSNVAGDDSCSVSGGWRNTASEIYAAVSGGSQNTAAALAAAVSGGSQNTAAGSWASISGGQSNMAIGSRSSISGGAQNAANDVATSVGGGQGNNAGGTTATIIGGCGKTTTSACEVQ